MGSPQNFLAMRGSAQVKQEPSLDDESLMDSTIPADFEAFIPDGFLCKEEIDIKWDDANNSIDAINDILKSPKPSCSIIVNNVQVNSQPNEFLNITATTSSKSQTIECPNCNILFRNKRSLSNHLRCCKRDVNYLCDKCSFVTSNKALLKLHNHEKHLPQACPKCLLVFANKQAFVKHFNKFCNRNAIDTTYTEMMLNKNSGEPGMQTKKLTTQFKLQRITSNINTPKIVKLVSAKSLYSKDYNNVAEDEIPKTLPVTIQSKAVKPNTVASKAVSKFTDTKIVGNDVGGDIFKSFPSKIEGKAAKPNTVASKAVSKFAVTKVVDKDYYEINEIVAETKKQKNNPINNKSKTAKVTKICKECDTQTEFDIANKCEKCNKDSIFRCNQCFTNFPNYQKVSYHLWTECTINGMYYCLKCDFYSPYKFRVLNHCKELHPEIHDPLEVETDYIEFREFNSKTGKADIPVLKCPLCDLQFKESVDYRSHLIACRKKHVEEKNVNNGATPKRKRKVATVGAGSSKNNTRFDLTKVSKYVVQYCAKCDKSIYVHTDNLRILQPCDGCSNYGHMCFKCTKCNRIFKNYERVRRHLKNRCIKQFLRCAKCDYVGTYLNLKKHSQDNHSMFPKHCQNCGKIFGDALRYNNHLGYCSKLLKTYFCDDCPFETNTKFNLKKHIFSVHFLPLTKKDFPSKLCNIRQNDRFKDSINYLQAYCTQCCERSSLKYRVKNCIKCKEKLNFICRICGRSSTIDDERACEHVKTHLELLQCLCSYCGKGFSAHDRRDFHMTFCAKKFFKNNKLDAPTTSCSKSLSVENNQDTNKRVNSKSLFVEDNQDTNKRVRGKSVSIGENQDIQTFPSETTPKSYNCQFCDYVSTVKSQVRRHERFEHPKNFKTLDELDPPKIKTFQCNVCSCEYTGKIDNVRLHILRRHVDVKNKSKIPPCEKCDWDFKGVPGLRKHLAYCGKKLYMPCRVNLTRINLEPVDSSRDLSVAIKEEIVDLNDFDIKMET